MRRTTSNSRASRNAGLASCWRAGGSRLRASSAMLHCAVPDRVVLGATQLHCMGSCSVVWRCIVLCRGAHTLGYARLVIANASVNAHTNAMLVRNTCNVARRRRRPLRLRRPTREDRRAVLTFGVASRKSPLARGEACSLASIASSLACTRKRSPNAGQPIAAACCATSAQQNTHIRIIVAQNNTTNSCWSENYFIFRISDTDRHTNRATDRKRETDKKLFYSCCYHQPTYYTYSIGLADERSRNST